MAMPNSHNGSGTAATRKLGDAELVSAPNMSQTPPPLPQTPPPLPESAKGLPQNLRQVVNQVRNATQAREAAKSAAETKKIPAIQTETDPRRAQVWITRLTDELADASPLMRTLWEIDPERKLKRIRALRSATKLNLKESKLVIDAVNKLIPTTSTDALETALMVAKQRDDLKQGLEDAQADLHFHREELREEVCEDIKEELQKRLQKKLSQFSALKNEVKQHRGRYSALKEDNALLEAELKKAEDAFDHEVEQGEAAETQIDQLRDEIGELDGMLGEERETWEAKQQEFMQMWNVIQFHYKEHMPHDRVFAGLLLAMGQLVGADVLEW